MTTVTKRYQDLPAAHRQPTHDGHCRLIHGHDWAFDITFGCSKLDDNGFVIDVGKLGKVRDWLLDHFDHTLLLNQGDPHLRGLKEVLNAMNEDGETPKVSFEDVLAKIVVVPNCSMEGLAMFVCYAVQDLLFDEVPDARERNIRVLEVTCWEDSKNHATYAQR